MYIVLKRGPGKEGVVKSGQPVVGQENANCARATCSRDHEKRGLSTDMERKQKRKKKEKKRKTGEEEGEVFELENAGTEKEGDEEEKKSSLFLPLSFATLRWNAFVSSSSRRWTTGFSASKRRRE